MSFDSRFHEVIEKSFLLREEFLALRLSLAASVSPGVWTKLESIQQQAIEVNNALIKLSQETSIHRSGT